MKKETIYILIIIAVWLLIGCILFVSMSSPEQQQIQIGKSKFIVPNGYHEDKHADNQVSISNSNVLVTIVEYNNTDINSYIQDYNKEINNQGQSNKLENFTIDNVQIYKSTNNNLTSVVHYWFVKNNKGYSIYTGDVNPHIDSIVIGIMDSLTPA